MQIRYIVAGIVGIGILYILFKRPTALKYRNLSPALLKRMVETLLQRGYNGGSLRIFCGDQTFCITKRVVAVGDVRLYGEGTLQLPAQQPDVLRESLGTAGPFFIEETLDPYSETRRLRVELGTDIEAAVRAIQNFSQGGWGIDVEHDCFASFEKVSELNIRVGWRE